MDPTHFLRRFTAGAYVLSGTAGGYLDLDLPLSALPRVENPMSRDRYEVAPTPKDAVEAGNRAWRLTRNGDVMAHSDWQYESVDLATRLCRLRLQLLDKTAELVIKGEDGRIRDARTYGRDPESSKG